MTLLRRRVLQGSLSALTLGLVPAVVFAETEKARRARGSPNGLVELDLPPPSRLRGGWAALAAVAAARGYGSLVYAERDQWLYNDGGGNWACLRYVDRNKLVLVGHDHEYSDTYFGEAAKYFGERETNLLRGAPTWWKRRLTAKPFGDWIGFVYGWDGVTWKRAAYDVKDGFDQVGLLRACSITDMEQLGDMALAPTGPRVAPPTSDDLRALVVADGNVSVELLRAALYRGDLQAGAVAARRFLEMRV